MKLKLKRLHPEAVLPKRHSTGAAGFDLVAIEDSWPQGAVEMARTGWAMEIPPGYEGQIRLRSSSGVKGLVIPHAPATIDSDYRGEILVAVTTLQNRTPGPLIKKGDRIAQMVICPVLAVDLEEAEGLSETERQGQGFGGRDVGAIIPSLDSGSDKDKNAASETQVIHVLLKNTRLGWMATAVELDCNVGAYDWTVEEAKAAIEKALCACVFAQVMKYDRLRLAPREESGCLWKEVLASQKAGRLHSTKPLAEAYGCPEFVGSTQIRYYLAEEP